MIIICPYWSTCSSSSNYQANYRTRSAVDYATWTANYSQHAAPGSWTRHGSSSFASVGFLLHWSAALDLRWCFTGLVGWWVYSFILLCCCVRSSYAPPHELLFEATQIYPSTTIRGSSDFLASWQVNGLVKASYASIGFRFWGICVLLPTNRECFSARRFLGLSILRSRAGGYLPTSQVSCLVSNLMSKL